MRFPAILSLLVAFISSAHALESKSSKFRNLSHSEGGEPARLAAATLPSPPPGQRHFSTTLRPQPPREAAGPTRTIIKIRKIGFQPKPKAPQPVYPASPGPFAGRRVKYYAAFAGALAALLVGGGLWSLRRRRARENDIMRLVAHELKSPLAAIESYLDLMSREGQDPASRELRQWLEDLSSLKTTAANLRGTISDILEMTSMESAKLRLDLKSADLRDLLEQAARLYRPQAQAAGLCIDLDLPAAAEPLSCDPARIRQVLHNLLSNAIKYTPRGGRIELSLRPEAGGVRIAVSDSGIGIAAEDRGRLFAKFSRIKPSITGQEGTGLGLFIAKTIVDAHGGRIEVQSAPGAGSSFRVYLPGRAHA